MGDKLKQTNSQIGNDALHFINRQIITVVLEGMSSYSCTKKKDEKRALGSSCVVLFLHFAFSSQMVVMTIW